MKDILTTIPKFTQWQSIPYAFDFQCQECGGSSIADTVTKANLAGWCETPQGFMMVFECPICYSKFRCHFNTGDKYDKDRFEYALYELVESRAYIGNSHEFEHLFKE